MRLKAALLRKVGELTLTNVKQPKCKSGEVLIRVKACAICPTDAKMVQRGHRDLALPRIPGHEVSGIIAEVGKKVKHFRSGARVQIAPGIGCGYCPYCITGAQNMCDHISIIGFHHDGGFAEYMLLPREAIHGGCINKIPDNLTFEDASLGEPIACCINALEAANFQSGESIAIWGAGFMGSLIVKLSRAYRASKVIAIDRDKRRAEISKKFGADYYVNNSAEDPAERVKELSKNRGVDVIVIACSDEKVPVDAIKLLSKRGRIVFFSGLSKEVRDISIDHNLIHYKELKMVGAYGCTSRQNRLAMELLSQGYVKVSDLITHRISLDEIEKGIEIVKSHIGMKVVIQNQEED
ncbi:zinc-dependent dehydrogenase [bacterium]|nr:zinc-dependent dehydrogenase [bacterium]